MGSQASCPTCPVLSYPTITKANTPGTSHLQLPCALLLLFVRVAAVSLTAVLVCSRSSTAEPPVTRRKTDDEEALIDTSKGIEWHVVSIRHVSMTTSFVRCVWISVDLYACVYVCGVCVRGGGSEHVVRPENDVSRQPRLGRACLSVLGGVRGMRSVSRGYVVSFH